MKSRTLGPYTWSPVSFKVLKSLKAVNEAISAAAGPLNKDDYGSPSPPQDKSDSSDSPRRVSPPSKQMKLKSNADIVRICLSYRAQWEWEERKINAYVIDNRVVFISLFLDDVFVENWIIYINRAEQKLSHAEVKDRLIRILSYWIVIGIMYEPERCKILYVEFSSFYGVQYKCVYFSGSNKNESDKMCNVRSCDSKE